MKSKNENQAFSLLEILIICAILALMALPLAAQMAVRVDNATKTISDPASTNFWPANPVPLGSLTNGLSTWTGSTNLTTTAVGTLGTAAATAATNYAPASHAAATNNPHGVTKFQVGLGNVDNTADTNKPISSATQAALDGKQGISEKNATNGYAGLDASGKLYSAQFPDEIDARMSVLSGTDSALSSEVLALGEIAAPTDAVGLLKGDGVTAGGERVGRPAATNGYTFLPVKEESVAGTSLGGSGIPGTNSTMIPKVRIKGGDGGSNHATGTGNGGAGGAVSAALGGAVMTIAPGNGGAAGSVGNGGAGGIVSASAGSGNTGLGALVIKGGNGGAGGSDSSIAACNGGTGGKSNTIGAALQVLGGSGGNGGINTPGANGGDCSGLVITGGNGGNGGTRNSGTYAANGGSGGNGGGISLTAGHGGNGGNSTSASANGGNGGSGGIIQLKGGGGAAGGTDTNGGAGGAAGSINLNGAVASGATAGGAGGSITANGNGTYSAGSLDLSASASAAGATINLVGVNVSILGGTGSPEGVKTANPGSMYLRTDGGAGTSHYIKESGTGNTGWVAK